MSQWTNCNALIYFLMTSFTIHLRLLVYYGSLYGIACYCSAICNQEIKCLALGYRLQWWYTFSVAKIEWHDIRLQKYDSKSFLEERKNLALYTTFSGSVPNYTFWHRNVHVKHLLVNVCVGKDKKKAITQRYIGKSPCMETRKHPACHITMVCISHHESHKVIICYQMLSNRSPHPQPSMTPVMRLYILY